MKLKFTIILMLFIWNLKLPKKWVWWSVRRWKQGIPSELLASPKSDRMYMYPKSQVIREIFISSCPLRGGLPEANPHGEVTGVPDRPFKFL